MWANLGRLEMEWGRKEAARAALARAQRLAPGNEEISRLFALVDLRNPSVLPFLPRSHPLNRWLGKLRYADLPRPDDEDED